MRKSLPLKKMLFFAAVAGGALTSLNNYFNTYFWGLSANEIFWINVIIVIAPVVALFLAPTFASRVGKKRIACGSVQPEVVLDTPEPPHGIGIGREVVRGEQVGRNRIET